MTESVHLHSEVEIICSECDADLTVKNCHLNTIKIDPCPTCSKKNED